MADDATAGRGDFIRQIIREDLEAGRHQRIATRFPPEPNGYLHIGHATAIHLNHGIAQEFGGTFNLRFDDTNPAAEDEEFVESIQADIRWLGCDWEGRLHFTSDYFPQLYEYACELIRREKAFVCDLSSEEMFERRGTLTEAGGESPFRGRSVEENLALFAGMKNGESKAGERSLRARIDMGSSVLPMRDPVIYRVVEANHHRTGAEWCVYPMYDFAHCLSDAIEGITHSLCSIEFVDHRPLYDWFLEQLDLPEPRPRQIEFAKFFITDTVLSKRNLRRLVEEGAVEGWDDPRMPTLAAFRRRGVPPKAIENLCRDVGITRSAKTIQLAQFDHHVRAVLNEEALRFMGVLRPLKVVIENYPEGDGEQLDAVNNPQDPGQGTRKVPFSREIWIERDDFLEDPPKKFFRMSPGREVRLRYAYLVTCTEVVKDASGEVVELRCTYDPETRGGDAPDGRKVKGTIHWVSAPHATTAEVRLYDHLFDREDPNDVPDGQDFFASLNPDSLETLHDVPVEPALASAPEGAAFQLERTGYFAFDPESKPEALVLNRTVGLRDTWAKVAKKG
ncbi:MAG: glutamine--tRNA ligase/YqeY domain fusion protein [Deltaproteobacteria bacterium]|nr:glutamine--tRNA ligase/YqeY domain fusion protein [Deltaproteobacteria bacterium]MBW2444827.1 glutamine--tRNA ligase/YqeY domain fusion protein [Deltaproteobacteria bacterium]